MKNTKERFLLYLVGLFFTALGVAVSLKSNLGSSPVSSIPYTITCVWGMEIGRATILFHAFLVGLQILILRRDFPPVKFLQIVMGIIFGSFTSLCNYGISFFSDPSALWSKCALTFLGAILIAVGIFFYVPANIMPLAGEGLIQIVSEKLGCAFSKIKIVFDVTVVLISLGICLVFLRRPGSVGVGTVLLAVLVGPILGVLEKVFGNKKKV